MSTNNNQDDANPRGMQRPQRQSDLNQPRRQLDLNQPGGRKPASDKMSKSPAENPRNQPRRQPDLNNRPTNSPSSTDTKSKKPADKGADKGAGKDDADPRGMPRPRERKVISTTPPSGSGTRKVPRGNNVGPRDEEGKPLTNKRNIMDKVRDRKIEKMKSRTYQGKPSRYGK